MPHRLELLNQFHLIGLGGATLPLGLRGLRGLVGAGGFLKPLRLRWTGLRFAGFLGRGHRTFLGFGAGLAFWRRCCVKRALHGAQ